MNFISDHVICQCDHEEVLFDKAFEMSGRTPIFSFETSTPSRRNHSVSSRRNHDMPSRSGVDVLNSIVNQSDTTTRATPSSRGRSSCENQTDSGIATPINTPSNSSKSGLVVCLSIQ